MKSLRLIALSAIFTIGTFSAILYTSCNKTSDPCSGITCQNGGTCSSGTCVCPTGYTGNLCQTIAASVLVKSWIASDVEVTPKDTAIATYSATIVLGSTGPTDIKIGNFSSFFTNDVNATYVGNTITIANQTPDADSFSVTGTGTYDSVTKKIAWNYSLSTPSKTLTYTGSWQ